MLSTASDENTSAETLVTSFKYKDGTTQSVKQEEFSAINHSITCQSTHHRPFLGAQQQHPLTVSSLPPDSIITSEPALTYTSVVSTIRVRPIHLPRRGPSPRCEPAELILLPFSSRSGPCPSD